MSRAVHVPYTVEEDEDGVWCAHAQLRHGVGAHGARLFWKVVLPAALPAIFTGLRLGLGLALIALVAVEFIAAKSGLGHLVYRHWQMLSTPEMYAAFALVGALGLAVTRGLRALQTRVLSWQEESF